MDSKTGLPIDYSLLSYSYSLKYLRICLPLFIIGWPFLQSPLSLLSLLWLHDHSPRTTLFSPSVHYRLWDAPLCRYAQLTSPLWNKVWAPNTKQHWPKELPLANCGYSPGDTLSFLGTAMRIWSWRTHTRWLISWMLPGRGISLFDTVEKVKM